MRKEGMRERGVRKEEVRKEEIIKREKSDYRFLDTSVKFVLSIIPISYHAKQNEGQTHPA